MTLHILKAKLHRIKVTESCLDYEGSLTLDPDDMEAVGILPYEKILVANKSNGSRLETYAIPGKAGSREFCLNGPAAKCGNVGDIVTIMAFSLFENEEAKCCTPRVIVLDENNRIIMRRGVAL